MPSLRRLLIVAASLVVVGASLPAAAQNQQPTPTPTKTQTQPPPQPQSGFTCTDDPGAQALGSGAPIVCTYTASNAPISHHPIDAEIMGGSVSDKDGTTAPPDRSSETDENGQVTFIFDGKAEGQDQFCIWPDVNAVDDIDEGRQCQDDDNTEVVTRTWVDGINAPVLNVQSSGVSVSKARELLAGLGVTPTQLKRYQNFYREDGSIQFIDRKLFQKIPTMPYEGEAAPDEDGRQITPRALDIEALEQLAPISKEVARRRVSDALSKANLAPRDLAEQSAVEWHTDFGEIEILAPDAANRAQVPGFKTGTFQFDTTISNSITVAGLPLEGPGQNLRVSFAPGGQVSYVRFTTRKVSVGNATRIITPETAVDRCDDTYANRTGSLAPNVTFTAEAFFRAPELTLPKVSKIYPHYLCTAQIQDGTTTLDVRPFEIPAIPFAALPRVTVTATNSGPTVTGNSTVTGGTPPYRYQWQSVLNEIPSRVATNRESVMYDVRVREESSATFEIVKLIVTDANGLRVWDYGYTPVTAIVGGVPLATRTTAYGTHYVGLTYAERARLNWTGPNTEGFKTVMDTAGVRRNYSLGEQMVWETDWVDPSLRATGNDDDYADNVDLFWFTGHANGDLFQISERSSHDDTLITFNDVRWGDRDLEWASIAACGPLQASTGSGDLQTRWGRAFHGLHILNGYATVSRDGDREGRTYASYLTGAGDSPVMPVRRSWSLMAVDAQGPTVIHGSMGPIGADWHSNIDDYFWGFGAVGADIPQSEIIGYWVIRYPS